MRGRPRIGITGDARPLLECTRQPCGLLPYQLIVVLCILTGSCLKIDLVWELTDFFNGIMVIPNLIALLLLSGKVAQLLKEYNEDKPFDRNRLR